MGTSALDTSWIDQVAAHENTNFLLLAEGLIMFFPKDKVAGFLWEIGARFQRSQLVLDTVPEKYTPGIWKFFLWLETRITWGLDAAWSFGIRDPQELENYGNGLKVMGVEKGSAGPIITLTINAA